MKVYVVSIENWNTIDDYESKCYIEKIFRDVDSAIQFVKDLDPKAHSGCTSYVKGVGCDKTTIYEGSEKDDYTTVMIRQVEFDIGKHSWAEGINIRIDKYEVEE